uniref:Uncharacterized protein n=1 Tax=Lepeophtheirus salmonis TaxID=72036 RepID=A0A0K2THJ9_LEPSM
MEGSFILMFTSRSVIMTSGLLQNHRILLHIRTKELHKTTV